MRIGILTDYEAVNSEYRSFPLLELAKRGHQVGLARNRRDLDIQRMRELDVLHIYRYRDTEMQRMARDLRDHGVGIVWDSDDDHTQGARGMPVGQRRGALKAQRSRREIERMLEIAHVVTAASPALTQLYREWGGSDVETVENYLPPNFGTPTRPPRRSDEVVVGWPAAGEHRHDARELRLRETFIDLLERFPQLRVVTIGIDLDIPHPRYERRPVVQYTELGSHIAGFDIGIAPIVDIPFNRARSRVKVKEYAGAGVPWLASPIGPYVGIGEREGGRLVPDEAWPEAIAHLIERPKDRAKLAKRAEKWAKTQSTIANIAAVEAPLLRAAARAQATALGPAQMR